MISIICPSESGSKIAFKLTQSLNAKLYIKNKEKSYSTDLVNYIEQFNLKDITKNAMENSDGVIFVSSTGIAVRAISPFLRGKDEDPGVVVVDLACKYAINILSGHLGGGNELTNEVAELLDVEPIITTATDNLGIVAPDMIAKKNNLIIDDLKIAKDISALLVSGEIVGINDDFDIVKITKGYKKINHIQDKCVWITNRLKPEQYMKYKVLRLIKKNLIIGIGCRRETSYETIKEFIADSFEKYGFDIRAVEKIVSVDIKKDENGIIEFAKHIGCPFTTFTRDEIRTVHDKYEKSEFVFKTLGINGVCEPCIDLGGGSIIINKLKGNGVTLAIGMNIKNL